MPAPTPAASPAVVPATPTTTAPFVAYQPYGLPDEDRVKDRGGSVYIPEDSWIYPEMMRLYSLGFVGTMNLEMRTYTRKSVLHMLEASENEIRESDSEEAKEIYTAVMRELSIESTEDGTRERGFVYGLETEYTRIMPITGVTLRDSYHLGQTFANDYGPAVRARLQPDRGRLDRRRVRALFALCTRRVPALPQRHRLYRRPGRGPGL